MPPENLEVSEGNYTSLTILSSEAHFSDDSLRYSMFALPLARCPRTRELGSAPPNRRAAALRQKTPQVNPSGPPFVGLAVPDLGRLALGPQFVSRLLSPIENASLIGEGLARATTGAAAGTGTSRSGIASRRTAPPLRTTGCLKDPESTVLRAASPGRLKARRTVFPPSHTRASANLRSPASSSSANCLSFAVLLGK